MGNCFIFLKQEKRYEQKPLLSGSSNSGDTEQRKQIVNEEMKTICRGLFENSLKNLFGAGIDIDAHTSVLNSTPLETICEVASILEEQSNTQK